MNADRGLHVRVAGDASARFLHARRMADNGRRFMTAGKAAAGEGVYFAAEAADGLHVPEEDDRARPFGEVEGKGADEQPPSAQGKHVVHAGLASGNEVVGKEVRQQGAEIVLAFQSEQAQGLVVGIDDDAVEPGADDALAAEAHKLEDVFRIGAFALAGLHEIDGAGDGLLNAAGLRHVEDGLAAETAHVAGRAAAAHGHVQALRVAAFELLFQFVVVGVADGMNAHPGEHFHKGEVAGLVAVGRYDDFGGIRAGAQQRAQQIKVRALDEDGFLRVIALHVVAEAAVADQHVVAVADAAFGVAAGGVVGGDENINIPAKGAGFAANLVGYEVGMHKNGEAKGGAVGRHGGGQGGLQREAFQIENKLGTANTSLQAISSK